MRHASLAVLLLATGLIAACDMITTPAPVTAKPGPAANGSQPVAAARPVYEIVPRSYPNQSNTTPVGWVSPEEKRAEEMRAEQKKAEERKAMEARQAMAAAAPAAKASASKTKAKSTASTPARAAAPKPAAMPSRPAEAMADKAAAAPGHWRAHVASHRSEEAAINDWQARLKAAPQVYGELEPALVWVDLPNRGAFARLTFGDYASKREVDTACARITGPGRYCNAVAE